MRKKLPGFRLLLLLGLSASLPPLSASAGPAPYRIPSAEDPVLTVAQVREEKATRTVELEPFRPVPFLEERLPYLPATNAQVIRTLLGYPRSGQHTYFWPKKGKGPAYDGCTTDVVVSGQTILKGEPEQRTFCCGLTLEVAWRVLQQQPRLPDSLTTATAGPFKQLWFCKAIDAPGPEDALLAFGVGTKISGPNEALPGDFVQIWRHDKSGHSVIFVAWAVDRTGQRVGLHYWSTQEATDGIGFRTELFGDSGKGVKREVLSVSRLLPPEAWKPVAADQITSAGARSTGRKRR